MSPRAYGIEGFTADHLAAFKRHGTQRVLIAYDRDEAGDRAAEKLARAADRARAWSATASSSRRGWMRTSTRSNCSRPTKSLGLVIRKAVWLGKGPAPSESPGQQIEDAAPASAPDITPLAASEPAPIAAEAVNPRRRVAGAAARRSNPLSR